MAKFKAMGVYAGIGAMLIAFHQRKSWKVLGNLEDRKIHTFRDEDGDNTFEEYFHAPLLPLDFTLNKEDDEIDLIAAQPKCGGFSNLYGTGRKSTDTTTATEAYGKDILTTIEKIKEIKPKVFYLENLPKSLTVVTAEMWHYMLPNYNIQFEYVSNYHYGNPQKGRNRLYVIGCRKDLDFIFMPREVKTGGTVKERIGDLQGQEGKVPNHDKHSRTDTDNLTNLAEDNTWKEIAKFVLTLKEGENLPYVAQDGDTKRRIGSNKLHWNKHSHTLAGIKGAKFHPRTGYPVSIRERCRLQGYPDDFLIYGTRYQEDGTWSLRKNANVVRQLNNTVPYEFTLEFFKQLNYYLMTGDLMYENPVRTIKPNKFVEEARKTK